MEFFFIYLISRVFLQDFFKLCGLLCTYYVFFVKGCKAVEIGLQNGCSFACNQSLTQERPNCMKGCLQGSQKLKEWLIDSLKNVKPPQIIPEKVTEYSLELVFDKHYSQNLQTKHPELHLSKCWLMAL